MRGARSHRPHVAVSARVVTLRLPSAAGLIEGATAMATGTSIVLIAIGAILAFATDAEVSGLDLQTVGLIMLVAGVLGLLVSMLWIDRIGRARSVHRVVEEPHVTERGL